MAKDGSAKKTALRLIVFLVDIGALLWFWRSLPAFRRPLDILLVLAIALGVLTALVAGRTIKNAMLVVVTAAFCLLALEMSQKYFDILSLGTKHSVVYGSSGPYAWTSDEPASYLDARQRAIEAGDLDPAMPGRHAGDIFARLDVKPAHHGVERSETRVAYTDALKAPYLESTPNGYCLAPDNLIRHYLRLSDTGDVLFDGAYTINGHGFRQTPGAAGGDGVVMFLGCSQTFGFGLRDDETSAYAYAEAGGFAGTTLNISMTNSGPHQALRELETKYHSGKAGVPPDAVRGVVYTLIDDHPNRVVRTTSPNAPHYRLENGEAVYRGTFREFGDNDKPGILYNRSRVWPALVERLQRRTGADSHRWRLTHAILRRMDEICRRDYGVGLTVVYWDESAPVLAELEANAIRTLPLSDAWGPNWRDYAIRYLLHDGHANAHGNRLIGKMVREALD